MMDIRAPKGFTLVELLIAITVAGILMAIAAPSFNSFIDMYRVKRAGDTISAFLINTKSEAIKRNTTVRAVFQSADSGATWCVGMTTASTCDCMVANACQIDSADRVVRGSDYKDIVLTSPADGAMFSFSPLRGTANSGNAQVQSDNGSQVRVIVTGTGRIRLCSPSGSANLKGYAVCS
jgi:type IV fimbrial biogenesis protein FimT